MILARSKLLDALSKVMPGLASNEVIEQSTSFVFQQGRAITFNGDIAVSHPVAGLDPSFQGVVKAEEFHSLIDKVSDEELEFLEEAGELKVRGKKFRAGVRMEKEAILPFKDIGNPSKWISLPENFISAINFCIFSAGTDMTRPLLTCLHVLGDFVESSDAVRLTRYDMGSGSEKSFPEPLLIPAEAAKNLGKYSPVRYGVTDGWIHFQSETGAVFSCRTLLGTYPDTSKILEVKGVRVVLPEGMKEMLDRAGIFAKGEFVQDEMVTITIQNGYIIVHGRGDDGWLKERTRIEYSDRPVEFLVNPSFLRQTLDLLHEITIGANRLRLDGQNFIHVMALKEPKVSETAD